MKDNIEFYMIVTHIILNKKENSTEQSVWRSLPAKASNAAYMRPLPPIKKEKNEATSNKTGNSKFDSGKPNKSNRTSSRLFDL